MKHLCFILLLFYASFFEPCCAQVHVKAETSVRKTGDENTAVKKKRDSLFQSISISDDDTVKVLSWISLAENFAEQSADTGILYAENAIKLARKLKYNRGTIFGYQALGMICQNHKNYFTAIAYFEKAIELASEKDVTTISCYSPLLNLYFYLGDYPKAMAAVIRELEIYEKLHHKSGIAHCNNLLGYIYFKQENFVEAEKFYARYLNDAKQLNDSILMAHALGEVSDLYVYEKKYDKAFNALFSSLAILKITLHSPQAAVKGQSPQMLVKNFYRLGKIYKLTGDYIQALKYAQAAVDSSLANATNDYEKAGYYINAGDIYARLKIYDKATSYLDFGYNLSKTIHHIENTRDAAESLAETYALQQRYDSAFLYYRIFTKLKDSIVNNETKMKIAGVQAGYDVAKKDKEIAAQKQFRNILMGCFALLLITILFLYYGYQLKQKHKYQQQLNRQQNELFNSIAAVQDRERKRIAEDIHDSLGSVLSAAKLNLSALKDEQSMSGKNAENLYVTLQLLDEASIELRNISHNIMPAALSKLGLVAALKNLIGKISSSSDMKVSFTSHEYTNRINEQAEMSIYRIVLELINNIVKHAEATKVTVQLIKYPAYINLSVEDNGRGFHYEEALQRQKGIGLANILSRVEYLNGTINVDTKPGRGTVVIIDFPYTEI